MSISKQSFGTLRDGTTIHLFTLTNNHGMRVQITNYGGIITSMMVPEKTGNLGDVVLGYDHLEGYLINSPYFGCIVGRYSNRIAGGRFVLSGKTINLATNNGPNHLHGGLYGFDKVVWAAKTIKTNGDVGLELEYISPDGEEGYPGNLQVSVRYTLQDDNALRIDYHATTDKTTVVNLTNHSYFNLKDGGASTILNHVLQVEASAFTPVDENLIPTGEIRSVLDTPFDFRAATRIGDRIDADDEQTKLGRGYDHNFVLNGQIGNLRQIAQVFEETTGRIMDVWTTEPGVQFYSGNFLDGSVTGKRGHVYHHRHGFCLETQHFPNSPNQPNFPATELKPGAIFQSTTIFKFGVSE